MTGNQVIVRDFIFLSWKWNSKAVFHPSDFILISFYPWSSSPSLVKGDYYDFHLLKYVKEENVHRHHFPLNCTDFVLEAARNFLEKPRRVYGEHSSFNNPKLKHG